VVPDADAIKKVERSATMNKKLFGTRLSLPSEDGRPDQQEEGEHHPAKGATVASFVRCSSTRTPVGGAYLRRYAGAKSTLREV
jgi:hypothetical protein